MSSKIVVLLTVGKVGGKQRTLSSAQTAVMKEKLLTKRACFPTLHASSGYRDPVDTACLIRNVAANFFKALSSKELAASGNMVLSFKAICCGTVTFLAKNSSC